MVWGFNRTVGIYKNKVDRGGKLNSEFNNRNLEIFLTLIASTVLILFGMYYFPFIIFLYPVLFIILGIRHGLKYSIITLLASSVLIGLLIDILSGILVFIAFMPLSLILINMIRKRKKPIETLLYSIFTFLASLLVIITLVDINGVSIIGQLKSNITQIVNSQMELLKQLDLTKEQLLEIEGLQKEYLRLVLAMVPSVIMILSIVVSYLNYLLSTLFLRKLGHGVVFIPRFSNFKLPRNIFLGLGVMFFTTFLLKGYGLFNSFEVILNLIVLTLFIFFLQGVAVIDYKLKQKKIKTVWRIFILLFLLDLIPLLGISAILLGLFDSIFDFRRIRSSN